MKWELPSFAHIPLIHSIEGKKLSKRDNASTLDDYSKIGIIPEALRNYLLRLGWSYEDKEIFSLEESIKLFNLEGIGHDDYMGAAKEVAPAFNDVAGLQSKVWLSDEGNNVYGGVYTWDNRQSMEDYLNSEFYDQVLGSNPNFVNISYKAYDVLDGPTSITNK